MDAPALPTQNVSLEANCSRSSVLDFPTDDPLDDTPSCQTTGLSTFTRRNPHFVVSSFFFFFWRSPCDRHMPPCLESNFHPQLSSADFEAIFPFVVPVNR